MNTVLSSTYREPELERILRDLEKVSAEVGLEKDGRARALKKAGVTNEDVVARQMHKANEELYKVERLEEERQFKTSADKLTVLKLTQKLQGLLEKMDETNVNEKKVMSYEID